MCKRFKLNLAKGGLTMMMMITADRSIDLILSNVRIDPMRLVLFWCWEWIFLRFAAWLLGRMSLDRCSYSLLLVSWCSTWFEALYDVLVVVVVVAHTLSEMQTTATGGCLAWLQWIRSSRLPFVHVSVKHSIPCARSVSKSSQFVGVYMSWALGNWIKLNFAGESIEETYCI